MTDEIITESDIVAQLRKTFAATDKIEVYDTAGDNNHYAIEITSAKFNNLTRLQQHQLVYEGLSDMARIIHAISIKTRCCND